MPPATPLDQSIAIALSLLAEGGEYHFKVKVDPETPSGAGRVSYDEDLGEGFIRYFSTLSLAELSLLKNRIESGSLQCSPELKNKLSGRQFTVEIGEISPHAVNPLKPPFADLFVTRVA